MRRSKYEKGTKRPESRSLMNLRIARSMLIAMGVTALVGLAASGLAACGSGSDGRSSDSSDPSATKNALPDGPVQVLAVEVSQPVAELGRVPLNTPVRGEWRLRNTGAIPVSLGRPSIEVLEGC